MAKRGISAAIRALFGSSANPNGSQSSVSCYDTDGSSYSYEESVPQDPKPPAPEPSNPQPSPAVRRLPAAMRRIGATMPPQLVPDDAPPPTPNTHPEDTPSSHYSLCPRRLRSATAAAAAAVAASAPPYEPPGADTSRTVAAEAHATHRSAWQNTPHAVQSVHTTSAVAGRPARLLADDVENASHDTLRAMCRNFGIPLTGDKNQLKQRLLQIISDKQYNDETQRIADTLPTALLQNNPRGVVSPGTRTNGNDRVAHGVNASPHLPTAPLTAKSNGTLRVTTVTVDTNPLLANAIPASPSANTGADPHHRAERGKSNVSVPMPPPSSVNDKSPHARLGPQHNIADRALPTMSTTVVAARPNLPTSPPAHFPPLTVRRRPQSMHVVPSAIRALHTAADPTESIDARGPAIQPNDVEPPLHDRSAGRREINQQQYDAITDVLRASATPLQAPRSNLPSAPSLPAVLPSGAPSPCSTALPTAASKRPISARPLSTATLVGLKSTPTSMRPPHQPHTSLNVPEMTASRFPPASHPLHVGPHPLPAAKNSSEPDNEAPRDEMDQNIDLLTPGASATFGSTPIPPSSGILARDTMVSPRDLQGVKPSLEPLSSSLPPARNKSVTPRAGNDVISEQLMQPPSTRRAFARPIGRKASLAVSQGIGPNSIADGIKQTTNSNPFPPVFAGAVGGPSPQNTKNGEGRMEKQTGSGTPGDVVDPDSTKNTAQQPGADQDRGEPKLQRPVPRIGSGFATPRDIVRTFHRHSARASVTPFSGSDLRQPPRPDGEHSLSVPGSSPVEPLPGSAFGVPKPSAGRSFAPIGSLGRRRRRSTGEEQLNNDTEAMKGLASFRARRPVSTTTGGLRVDLRESLTNSNMPDVPIPDRKRRRMSRVEAPAQPAMPESAMRILSSLERIQKENRARGVRRRPLSPLPVPPSVLKRARRHGHFSGANSSTPKGAREDEKRDTGLSSQAATITPSGKAETPATRRSAVDVKEVSVPGPEQGKALTAFGSRKVRTETIPLPSADTITGTPNVVGAGREDQIPSVDTPKGLKFGVVSSRSPSLPETQLQDNTEQPGKSQDAPSLPMFAGASQAMLFGKSSSSPFQQAKISPPPSVRFEPANEKTIPVAGLRKRSRTNDAEQPAETGSEPPATPKAEYTTLSADPQPIPENKSPFRVDKSAEKSVSDPSKPVFHFAVPKSSTESDPATSFGSASLPFNPSKTGSKILPVSQVQLPGLFQTTKNQVTLEEPFPSAEKDDPQPKSRGLENEKKSETANEPTPLPATEPSRSASKTESESQKASPFIAPVANSQENSKAISRDSPRSGSLFAKPQISLSVPVDASRIDGKGDQLDTDAAAAKNATSKLFGHASSPADPSKSTTTPSVSGNATLAPLVFGSSPPNTADVPSTTAKTENVQTTVLATAAKPIVFSAKKSVENLNAAPTVPFGGTTPGSKPQTVPDERSLGAGFGFGNASSQSPFAKIPKTTGAAVESQSNTEGEHKGKSGEETKKPSTDPFHPNQSAGISKEITSKVPGEKEDEKSLETPTTKADTTSKLGGFGAPSIFPSSNAGNQSLGKPFIFGAASAAETTNPSDAMATGVTPPNKNKPFGSSEVAVSFPSSLPSSNSQPMFAIPQSSPAFGATISGVTKNASSEAKEGKPMFSFSSSKGNNISKPVGGPFSGPAFTPAFSGPSSGSMFVFGASAGSGAVNTAGPVAGSDQAANRNPFPPSFGSTPFGSSQQPPTGTPGQNATPAFGGVGGNPFSAGAFQGFGSAPSGPAPNAAPTFGGAIPPAPKPTNAFGAAPASGGTVGSFGASNNSGPSFGGSSSLFGAPSAFGAVPNTGSSFGTPSNNNQNSFGATPSSNPVMFGTPSAAPSFGAAPSSGPVFGSVASSGPVFGAAPSSGPMFGGQQNAGVAFGTPQTPAAGAFNVGTQQPPANRRRPRLRGRRTLK